MSAKDVKFGAGARAQMLAGVDILANAVKTVITNVAKYMDISANNNNIKKSYIFDNYINKNKDDVIKELSKMDLDIMVIGDGNKIINQYPLGNNTVYSNDKVFLLTDSYTKKMPNLIGYSYKEASNLLNLIGISFNASGNGYVYFQSINEGTLLNDEQILTINLKGKYDS